MPLTNSGVPSRANTNAVENLVVFGILAIALDMTQTNTPLTASAAAAYFAIRATHYVVYIFAVPWARTPIFIIGLDCQMVLNGTLVSWLVEICGHRSIGPNKNNSFKQLRGNFANCNQGF